MTRLSQRPLIVLLRRFALAVALLSAWSPLEALAQPAVAQRVVVQRFSGPRGSTVRRALVRSLSDHGVDVVDEEEVREVRERLGFGRTLEGAQYTELARELNVAAFVDGRVSRRRRRWGATIRVRNAADAQELGSASWGGRTAASLGAVGRSGHARLSQYLSQAQVPPTASQEPGETPWYQSQDDEAPPSGEPEEPEEAPPTDRSTRYDAISFALLGGTLHRQMSTTVQVYESHRPFADPSGPSAPTALLDEARTYQSAGIGHFELGGRLELYPGAFEDQPFPYLGVVVSFSHSVGLTSIGYEPDPSGAQVSVPTEQLDLYLGVRGRYRFGPARREPEIHFDVGWGMFQFDLGLDALELVALDTIVPPMEHGYFNLGAGIEYGVVPTYLTLGLDVGARIGTNIGTATRNVWGTTTGPSNGFLIGGHAKVEIPELFEGFFVGLSLSYFQFITDFSGQVGCARAEECDAYVDPWDDRRRWEVWPVAAPPTGEPVNLDDVVGGPRDAVTDHYVRLQLSIGFAYY